MSRPPERSDEPVAPPRTDTTPDEGAAGDGSGSLRSLGGNGALRSLGEYSMIGMVFPLAMLIGFFFGRWAGALAGAETAGAGVGIVLGTVAAFYNLFATLGRIERRERKAGEQDPEPP